MPGPVPTTSSVEHRTLIEGDSARSPRLGHAFFGLKTAMFGVGPLPIPPKTPAKARSSSEVTPEHGP